MPYKKMIRLRRGHSSKLKPKGFERSRMNWIMPAIGILKFKAPYPENG